MAKTEASIGSNTRITMQTRGDSKEAWLTIDQGSKFIQTAASYEELIKLRDSVDKIVRMAGVR